MSKLLTIVLNKYVPGALKTTALQLVVGNHFSEAASSWPGHTGDPGRLEKA